MTVKELIEKLQECDPEMEVFMGGTDCRRIHNVDGVEQRIGALASGYNIPYLNIISLG